MATPRGVKMPTKTPASTSLKKAAQKQPTKHYYYVPGTLKLRVRWERDEKPAG